VNTVLRTALLAASLLAASLLAVPAAHAADAAVRPVKPAPGPVMDAMQSLARDMQADQDPRLPLPAQLERAAAFRPMPATAAKLRAVFGNDHPYTIERRPAKAGRLAYRARLQPLHYKGDAGVRTDWDEALLDLDMDKAGKTVDFTGRWNTVSAEDPAMRLSAEGITLSGHQRRSEDKLWFGNGQLRIARVRGETPQTPNAGTDLSLNDLRMDWRTVEHPKTVDMQFQQRIGSIDAAGEKVEDVRLDVRIVNIDRATMVALQAAGERQRQQLKTMTPEQQLAAVKPLFQDFGKAAIARGSSIEIDEISARYRGNKASIRGRIGTAGAVEADLGDLKTLVKKIVASFEIRVPVAMVRDIAGVVAAKQAKQQGAAANGMGPAQMGQTLTDIVVGKLVGGGYARIENDVLVSKVEFRDGELTANGKKVELPKPAAGGAVPAVTQRPTLPANTLQARRIEDSCRLPDFPDEVVDQDQPLHAGFSYRVDAEGKVENVRVRTSSGYPAWDQAMVEALGLCRYIPALQDGKPLGLQIDWNVARTRGGPRSPVPTP
jgi:TonB family protein